jgi:hypothetical protein
MLVTWEAGIRRISVQGSQGNSSWDPISKITRAKWTGGMAQAGGASPNKKQTNKIIQSQAFWCTPVIPALGGWGRRITSSKPALSYIARTHLKRKKESFEYLLEQKNRIQNFHIQKLFLLLTRPKGLHFNKRSVDCGTDCPATRFEKS